jgi:alkanesulfonate monooxygenase SsuD/methylene tetrahydromethanopterin reductase-like flavin-dependent oxidoreductase (luciferase family)
VKFSVTLGTGGDGRDPAALADLAALAESAGWDAFLLEDYLCYRDLPTYDPWVCLAAIATATTRIRLGTTVTPPPRRQPWDLAAQAVAIDHLSGGRLILGVGSGATDDPGFTATGTPMSAPERAARLDEGLEILTSLWTGTPADHHGRYYHLNGLRLPATPVQQPQIPIWIGGDLRHPGVRRRLTPDFAAAGATW